MAQADPGVRRLSARLGLHVEVVPEVEREELVNAIFADRMDAYADAVTQALADPDPWHGFTGEDAPDTWRRLVGLMLHSYAAPGAPIPALPEAPRPTARGVPLTSSRRCSRALAVGKEATPTSASQATEVTEAPRPSRANTVRTAAMIRSRSRSASLGRDWAAAPLGVPGADVFPEHHGLQSARGLHELTANRDEYEVELRYRLQKPGGPGARCSRYPTANPSDLRLRATGRGWRWGLLL
ncbi:hypothetical protein [Streptomyces caniscabiei]|uniref:hypothetical protein n=1 Tax=Streptomyces caniscabiei TaxID=2746961 RepID=UPI001F245ED2|nr:hypothetical protein [Streptomyces caniscabiei]